MPRGDFSGPWGQGPMTGRGAGYCAGFPTPGYMNPGGRRFGFRRGFGFGRGFGPGRGYGGGYAPWGAPDPAWAEPAHESEAAMLKDMADSLELQLKQIKKRLSALEDENEG
ncbi:MAG: DUF5320 domain-containing protein [Firmicutes bacterium]|nr:DUF5320 domain-containing protein [Bacillota bacterium]